MGKQRKVIQDTLFDLEQVSRRPGNQIVHQKKVVLSETYTIQGETGLNSVWKNFGEWIENGRNNKTILYEKRQANSRDNCSEETKD